MRGSIIGVLVQLALMTGMRSNELTSLRWSLSTDSDGPMDDFNLAWMRIPTEEQLPAKPRQLYAVMAPTAPLTARLAAWRHVGVRPKVIDIRETALRNIAGALERPGEGLALLSAGTGGVSMVFTHQGSLYLDRTIERFPEHEALVSVHQHLRYTYAQFGEAVDRCARAFIGGRAPACFGRPPTSRPQRQSRRDVRRQGLGA